MLRSYEFKKHWDDMPEIKEYNYSVALHESIFTRKFSDMGFKYEIYLDSEDIKNYDNYPLMFNAHTLIREKRSPFIKRKRNTFVPYAEVLNHDFNYGYNDMLGAINECSDYDIDLVLRNTLRTSELYTFQRGSCLNVISSQNYTSETKTDRSKTCIIINIADREYYDNILKPVMDSIKKCDIIIIADVKVSKECFGDREITLYSPTDEENTQITHKQIYKIIEDKRDNYDFIISLNFDKRLEKVSPPHHSFHIMQLKMLADSFISSSSQVDAVIDLFNKNKLQGILTGPAPVAGASYNNNVNYRDSCTNVIKKYAEYIGVENSPQNTYQYPYSNIFACRTAALDGFINSVEECFEKNENLPYEVLVPLYAQSKGYYTSRIMTEHNALIYMDLLENIITRLGGKL